MRRENLTDKCASVHVCTMIQTLFPSNTSSFVMNVRLDCILEDDQISCKKCTDTEIQGMVHMIGLLNNFVEEIGGGRISYINVGGTATNKIGAELIRKQIIPSKRVLAKGYHMCNFVSKNRGRNWSHSDQQYDVTNFVVQLDNFFAINYGTEKRSLLQAFISNPRMRYVVDIDPKTKLETEASRNRRTDEKREELNKRRREQAHAMPTEKREELNKPMQCQPKRGKS